MRRIIAATAALVAVGLFAAGPAAADTSVPAVAPRDALPASVSTYPTSTRAAALPEAEADDVEVLRRPALSFSGDVDPDAPSGKQSWWPVLYSFLIPGAGEVSMGYEKRGIALIAAEAVAWSGYFYYHNQGLDTRQEYEDFADANWNQQKFVDDHPLVYPANSGLVDLEWLDNEGQKTSGSGAWPGYSPWVSKEEDKQHYYENIGKYDWYISGWADWDPDAQPHDTSLRTQYRSMREQSNDELNKANDFVYISIGARVFSLIETTLLVRRARADFDAGMARLDNHWDFNAQPRGFDGAVVSMEYRFK